METIEKLRKLYKGLDVLLEARKSLNEQIKAAKKRIDQIGRTGEDPNDDGQMELAIVSDSVEGMKEALRKTLEDVNLRHPKSPPKPVVPTGRSPGGSRRAQ